jgi:Leucine-rich repeat (LRR) protein
MDDGDATGGTLLSEDATEGDVEGGTRGGSSAVVGLGVSLGAGRLDFNDATALSGGGAETHGRAKEGTMATKASSSGVEKGKDRRDMAVPFEGADAEHAGEARNPSVSRDVDGAAEGSLQNRPGAFRVDPGGPLGGRSVRGLPDEGGETTVPEREEVVTAFRSEDGPQPTAAYDGETYLVEASLVRAESTGESDAGNSSSPGRRGTLPPLVVAQPLRRNKRMWIVFGVGSLLVIGLAIGIAFAVIKTRPAPPAGPTPAPSGPPIPVAEFFDTLPEYTRAAIRNASSPQGLAFQWLNSSDPKDLSLPRMTQRFALATLGIATGVRKGGRWTNSTGWLEDAVDVCNWFGCLCPEDNVTVRTLGLNDNQLAGMIPREIGLIAALTDLGLSGNALVGSIPAELKLLNRSLVSLDVSSNNFTGTLPTELGLLTGLMALGLSNNRQIRGPLPTELGRLSVLSGLWLQHMSLASSLPTEFGNLTRLEKLASGDTGLIGPIPTELGRLSTLKDLDLSTNNLSSTLPSELGNLTLLNSLRLYENRLNGTIPPEVLALSSLTDLQLQSNSISGSIPSDIGKLSRLQYLYLYDNYLTGTIPTELGKLTSVKEIDFSDNDLNGTVPEELCKLIQNGASVTVGCELECSCNCSCY